MEADLHITDQQYLIALTIFFIPYAIFEVSFVRLVPLGVPNIDVVSQVPSNVFLKRLRPSIWLSLLMFFWGIIMVRRNAWVTRA